MNLDRCTYAVFLSHVEESLCDRLTVLVINHCFGLLGRIKPCYEPNVHELGVQCLGILHCLTRTLPPEVGDTQDNLDRCTYVCTYVTRYLDIRSLLFSETLQLDRALGV